ncbi:MAG TPA: undecaprenyl-phosphate glucose phosphotransferase [Chitinophagales bacterium]|nr:undecaprenyl-phosphate glucose phosphotransferase [Chitinophagales bacterium]
MIREKFRLYSIINLFGDIILLVFSFLLGYLIIWGDFKANFRDFFLQATISMVICWLIVAYFLELYTPKRFEQFEKSFSKHFQAIVFHAMLLSTVILLFTNYGWPGILFVYGYFFFLISDTLLRIGLMYQLRRERLSGKNTFRVIVVGGDGMGKRMFDTLNDYTGYGFKPLGIFDDKALNGAAYQLNGTIEDAKRFAIEHQIDEIFCALPLRETEKINQLLRFAEDNLIRFKVVPDFSAFHNRNITVDFYGFYPVISLQPEPLSNVFNQMIKRSFDIVFSSLVIVLILSWLIPLVALLIRLDSKGPVFYFQNRSGKDYQIFKIFKFRTMTVTEADTEYVQAQKNDSRITRVGKYLRKLNVDELPQFLNVWLGDMSVVGPRPHPIKLNEIYRPIVEKYMTRHLAKPGLTGLAQVRGFRGETADPEMMHGRVVADVFYIENWSFLLDIKIILLTVWNMVKGEKNAY